MRYILAVGFKKINKDSKLDYFIAGVDEAGRGPLAGPVFAGAVILDPENPIDGFS